LGILVALLLLLVVLYLLLQLPSVQNYVKDKVLASISEQYNADWKIRDLRLTFFDELHLEGIDFRDQRGDTLLIANELHIDIGLFSLFNKSISIDEIELTGAHINLYEIGPDSMNFSFLLPTTSDSVSVDPNASSGLVFSISNILLNDFELSYLTPSQSINIKEKVIAASIRDLDLENQIVHLNALTIDELDASLDFAPSEPSDDPFELPDLGWTIRADNFDISKSSVVYKNDTSVIAIDEFNAALAQITYVGDSLALRITSMNADVRNQINLQEFSTEMTLAGDQLTLNAMRLKTPTDNLALRQLTYNINQGAFNSQSIDLNISPETLKLLEPFLPEDIVLLEGQQLLLGANQLSYQNQLARASNLQIQYGKALDFSGNLNMQVNEQDFTASQLDANINYLKAGLPALDRMLKSFSIPDSLSHYQTLKLNGKLSGTMKRLQLAGVQLSLDDVFSGDISGRLTNLDAPDRLGFDVSLDNLMAKVDQLPIPPNDQIAIDSLGILRFDGKISGNLSQFKINGAFQTDLGDADLDVALSIPDSIANLTYDGEVNLDNFDLGVFLKNDELDKITIKTKINGKGLDIASLDSKIDGTISNFSYNGYQYADLTINAKISDGNIDGQIAIDDENIKLSYDGTIKLGENESVLDFTARIDTLNLAALGFMPNELGISGLIESNFSLPLNPGRSGRILLTDFNFSNPAETFYADSILMLAEKRSDSTFIDVRSDAFTFDIDGIFGIRDLPIAFMRLLSTHVDLIASDSLIDIESQSVHIDGEIRTLKPLDIYMEDELVQSGLIDIDLVADFGDNELNGKIEIDSFFYGDVFSEKIEITARTDDNLHIDIDGNNNLIGNAELAIVNFYNELNGRSIASTVEAKDDDSLPRFRFKFNTAIDTGVTTISLQDSIILNKKDWMVDNNNNIRIYSDKIIIDQFELTDQNEFLKIQSIDNSGENIDIDFKNFNIGQFVTLMTSEPSLLSGNIDGGIEIRDLQEGMYFLSAITIDDINYDSTFVGQMTINAADDPKNDFITGELKLNGPENDVTGGGKYNTETQDMDFNLDVDRLELRLLDPFLSEVMRESEGALSGSVQLQGNAEDPVLDGRLRMKNVVTTIVANNARYKLEDHVVTFDKNQINLGQMSLMDVNNRVANVSGIIDYSDINNMTVDISASTPNFLFLNTTKKDNPLFYGKLLLDAEISVQGPIDLLEINAVATTLDSTAITLSPLASESFAVEEGFITYGKPEDFQEISNAYLLKQTQAFPFNVNLLLDVDNDAAFEFVLDPVTGDKIQSVGKGDLRIRLNADGSQEIFGLYEVEEGSYAFSYGDFVSKDFSVKQGGTVRFNGDPLEAELDIDAVYSVYTSTYELIKNEVTVNENELAGARRRTNVEVYLSLEGSLDAPLITLDIQIPDLQSSSLVGSIDRKLNELRSDPNELNNQVFGLLIFNSFIVSDNSVSGIGTMGSNLALKSISSLISNKLNDLASNVIKGVDVNINVNSYESQYVNDGAGGNVTEIGLEVSKQLFNDRLSISAGGNLDLTDGGSESGGYAALIGDFVLEYKLTENGRYRVRVFSKSDYDQLLNENSTKNGISIFYNRTFDSKINE